MGARTLPKLVLQLLYSESIKKVLFLIIYKYSLCQKLTIQRSTKRYSGIVQYLQKINASKYFTFYFDMTHIRNFINIFLFQ